MKIFEESMYLQISVKFGKSRYLQFYTILEKWYSHTPPGIPTPLYTLNG